MAFMTAQLTNYQKIKALPWLYIHIFFIMVFAFLGFWGPVFPLFLRTCGLSIKQIGMITSIIPMVGVVAIFIGDLIKNFGTKKAFIIGTSGRTLVFGLALLPVCFLNKLFSPSLLFFWLLAGVFAFAICRAVAESSYIEWTGEIIPNERRGRTEGLIAIIVGTVGALVAGFTAWFSKIEIGINLFGSIFSISFISSLIAILPTLKLPGGEKKISIVKKDTNFLIGAFNVLNDKNFIFFLLANNLMFFYWGAFLAFWPIFLKEQLEFSQPSVFVMEMCLRGASIFTCFLWGWCSDRFGSKPVFMTGVYGFLLIPLPFIFYSLLPSGWLLNIFIFVYILVGLLLYAFVLGANRYFFVKAVPKDASRVHYVTVSFAVQSLCLGIGPLFSGFVIDSFHWLNKNIYGIQLCQYTPFFIMLIVINIIALIFGRKLVSDTPLGTGRFLTMFIEGNPFTAFGNIIRFHRSVDEDERMLATRNIGEAGTRLGMADLLVALRDPSFNVRYEAVLALSQVPFDENVLEALKRVLYSEEPGLSELAGWILGGSGDVRAIEPLRYMLKNGRYALLRARCARSLANLGDIDSAKEILRRFREEGHIAIKVAYAAALGKLKVIEAFDEIEKLLGMVTDVSLQGEVGLAIARMLGVEQHFVRLWRVLQREDSGVGITSYMVDLINKYSNNRIIGDVKELFEKTSDLFALGDYITGMRKICDIVKKVLLEREIRDEAVKKFLERSLNVLESQNEFRRDYLILVLILIEHVAIDELKAKKLVQKSVHN